MMWKTFNLSEEGAMQIIVSFTVNHDIQMTYVYINPVTDRMTDSKRLEFALRSHQMKRVFCQENWPLKVLKEYSTLVEQSDKTVLDTRCPMAVRLLRTLGLHDMVEAPIAPILLSCAKELSHREDLVDGQIVVTTPCMALAEQGNLLKLPRTTFVTAREFLLEIGYHTAKRLDSSPIPPGFFDSLAIATVSASGKEEIAEKAVSLPKDTELFEVLFCPGGCHNGDGV